MELTPQVEAAIAEAKAAGCAVSVYPRGSHRVRALANGNVYGWVSSCDRIVVTGKLGPHEVALTMAGFKPGLPGCYELDLPRP